MLLLLGALTLAPDAFVLVPDPEESPAAESSEAAGGALLSTREMFDGALTRRGRVEPSCANANPVKIRTLLPATIVR